MDNKDKIIGKYFKKNKQPNIVFEEFQDYEETKKEDPKYSRSFDCPPDEDFYSKHCEKKTNFVIQLAEGIGLGIIGAKIVEKIIQSIAGLLPFIILIVSFSIVALINGATFR